MTETWKWVPGLEGQYEVSDLGRVRSVNRRIEYMPGKMRHAEGRVLRPGRTGPRRDYLAVNVGGRLRKVHLLVAAAFIGPRPDGLVCRHLDGDPQNNRADNLAYGTHAENMGDAIRHGTTGRGSRNSQARLSPDEVRDIRRRVAAGEARRRVAMELGLSHQHVGDIVARRRWAHLEDDNEAA